METSQPVLFDELARCREWLEPGLEYAGGTYLWDDVVAGVYSGRFRLWALEKSALLTEIHQYPRKRNLHVFLGGGNLKEILGFLPELEQSGREIGCTSITCAGRRGWHRVVAQDGLKPQSYFTEREL